MEHKCHHILTLLRYIQSKHKLVFQPYVIYAKEQKIEVLKPDINKSETYFSVEDGKLRFGLAALKNVGVSVIDAVIEERNKNGEYKMGI